MKITDFFNHLIYGKVDRAKLSLSDDRRIRLLYQVLFWGMLFTCVFLVRAVQWEIVTRATYLSVSIIIMATLFFIDPYRKNLDVTGNIFSFAIAIAVTGAILTNGGLNGPSFGWLILLPLMAGLVVGLKSGISWTLYSSFITALLFVLRSQGIEIPNSTPEQFQSQQMIMQYFGMLILIVIILYNYLVSLNILQHRYQETIDTLEQVGARKDRFMSNLSHELRTPLNAILGSIDLLHQNGDQQKQQETLALIKNAAILQYRLIDNLLLLVEHDHGVISLDKDKFNPKELIVSLCTIIESELVAKNTILELQLADNIPNEIVGDAARLQQILINIIDYSANHMEKGRIILGVTHKLSTDDITQLQFNLVDDCPNETKPAPETIQRALQDKQVELDHDYLETGLSMAAELIRYMGGQLEVKSLDIGCQFIFELNFSKSEQVVPQQQAEQLVTDNHDDLKVLLVEDNIVNCKVIGKMVQSLGVDVFIVHNGQQALEYIADNPLPLLILMDLQMPVMGGIDACKNIREKYNSSELPVIAVSASVTNHDIKASYDCGMNEYLAKPLRRDVLNRAFQEWLPGYH